MGNLDKVMEKINKSKTTEDLDKLDDEVKEKPAEPVKQEPVEEDDLDDDVEEEAKEEVKEKPVEEPKVVEKSPEKAPEEVKTPSPEIDAETEQKEVERRAREIEVLQNDGVFRAELLFQLNSVNKHLYVLNSLIKGLTK